MFPYVHGRWNEFYYYTIYFKIQDVYVTVINKNCNWRFAIYYITEIQRSTDMLFDTHVGFRRIVAWCKCKPLF